jgi:AcrR family transcriptional regulator
VPDAPRSYDSPRRRASAAATRRRIIDAAGGLFRQRGYAATSMRAVAAAAHVAPETVYLVFGTKSALLSAWIDVSVGGDDEPVAFVDRPEVRALAGLATFEERLAAAMTLNRTVNERVADPLAVLGAAALGDPDLAAMSTGLANARRTDVERLLAVVVGDLRIRDDADRHHVVDLVCALLSVQLYRDLVVRAGWTPRQYEVQTAAQVRQAVLGPCPPPDVAAT